MAPLDWAKSSGKMRPSPFALNLIEDVRPILRSIQRAVQPPQPFESATSDRMFRVAIPTVTEWITEVHARVKAVAPDVGLEWITPNSQSCIKVADGQTVEKPVAHFGNERRIGASIPDFSGVAPILARTNLLTNQLPVTLSDGLERYKLRVLEPPVELPEISFRIVWSTRLANEPGNRWLRELVIDSFEDIQTRNQAQVAAAGVIPVQT